MGVADWPSTPPPPPPGPAKIHNCFTCVIDLAGQNRTKLKDINLIAIGVGIGITLSLVSVIIYFLIRGTRRLQETKLGNMPRFAVEGQVNDCSTAQS